MAIYSYGVRGLLDRAIRRFGTDWCEVFTAFSCGNAVLWLATVDDAPIAAMVTRRDGETMEVWLAGGAVLSGCVPFLLIAEREAIEFGMTKGRITGRKGWTRVLSPYGWRVDGEDLVKDLGNGQEQDQDEE